MLSTYQSETLQGEAYDKGLLTIPSNSFFCHSDIFLLQMAEMQIFERGSDSECQQQGGESGQQTFSPSESLDQTSRIHFDKCISNINVQGIDCHYQWPVHSMIDRDRIYTGVLNKAALILYQVVLYTVMFTYRQLIML